MVSDPLWSTCPTWSVLKRPSYIFRVFSFVCSSPSLLVCLCRPWQTYETPWNPAPVMLNIKQIEFSVNIVYVNLDNNYVWRKITVMYIYFQYNIFWYKYFMYFSMHTLKQYSWLGSTTLPPLPNNRHLSQPTFCGGDAAEIMNSYWNIPICCGSVKRKPRISP